MAALRVRLYNLPNFGSVQITRFMVMELIAAFLMIAIMIPVVRHIARNPVSRGWFMNMFEHAAFHPRSGRTTGDRRAWRRPVPPLPLDSLFLFVLFNNLLGMFPGSALATGNVNVTAVLALLTLVVLCWAPGCENRGGRILAGHCAAPRRSQSAQAPAVGFDVLHRGRRAVDPPCCAGRAIIRQYVRRARGPLVVLGFTLMAWSSMAFWLVMPVSIGGVICLSLLELFVAFLQAYVFTFLSALFIRAAVHPH